MPTKMFTDFFITEKVLFSELQVTVSECVFRSGTVLLRALWPAVEDDKRQVCSIFSHTSVHVAKFFSKNYMI